MTKINEHAHESRVPEKKGNGPEVPIKHIREKTLRAIRDIFSKSGKIDQEDVRIITQKQNVIHEITNALQNKECEQLSPLIRKIFFDTLSWNPENVNNYAIIQNLKEIQEELPRLRENPITCLILYAYFQQIESVPAGRRHFFDVAIDPRILADKGFSLEECVSLFSKTCKGKKLDEKDFLELFELMTERMELFRQGREDKEGEEELLKRGLSKQDISPHNGQNYIYTKTRLETFRQLIKQDHLDINEIRILSFGENLQVDNTKKIHDEIDRKTGGRASAIQNDLMEIVKRDDEENPSIQMPFRSVIAKAIQKTSDPDTKIHQMQNGITKSIFNKLHGLKEKIMFIENNTESDMNLANIYLDRSNEDHQGYLNTAQIGFHFKHLEALQKIYQFWIQRGIPSKVYKITKKLYEKAFREYAKKMGMETEVKAFHFASGSTAIRELIQFLPKGTYVTTNRDYVGNIDSIREVWGENMLRKIHMEKDGDMAKEMKTQIEKMHRDNSKEKIYLFIPEVSFDGTVFPITEMKKYCHENNIVLMVDSCQAMGCKETEFGDINIFSHQKANGLPGSAGTILIDEKLYKNLCGNMAKTLEPKGTVDLHNMLTIIHILTSMQDENTLPFGDPLANVLHGYNKNAGIKNAEKTLLEIQRKILKKIAEDEVLKRNIEIITSNAKEAPGRLCFKIKDWVGDRVVDELAKLGVQTTSLSNYGKQYEDVIRISFSHLQSEKAMEKFFEAIRTILRTSTIINNLAQGLEHDLTSDYWEESLPYANTKRSGGGGSKKKRRKRKQKKEKK